MATSFKGEMMKTDDQAILSVKEPLIKIRAISKVFKSGAGEFTALDNIHLDFYRGEFVCIVGKSGSGKSTLANMITGIDHPTSGEIIVDGQVTNRLNESEMSTWRGNNLGIVFQFYQLLPMLTLLENVILPMDFCDHYDVGEREARAMELLKLVGLQDFAYKLPAMTSGGQQQTAAIARALANDPPILIADEPTGNLDSRTAESVFDLFCQLVAKGKTIIMVTHDPALAERSNRVVKIHDGKVVQE
ncbi:MAG: ABC transporter ATP-binding protein [Anaerolineaceae bacterium]|nr:ABC transporter ATP-binding protein [Anaerolineaceae bacterium]